VILELVAHDHIKTDNFTLHFDDWKKIFILMIAGMLVGSK
jgi:hypothetical protein